MCCKVCKSKLIEGVCPQCNRAPYHSLEVLDALVYDWSEQHHDFLMFDDQTETCVARFEIDGYKYYVIDSPWGTATCRYDPTDIKSVFDYFVTYTMYMRKRLGV